MIQSAYPSARLAAEAILAHLAESPTHPDLETATTIIDAAFWASLRREEGRTPLISLAFVPPEQVTEPLTFSRSLPVLPQTLTQLAPAVERPGIHLGVWHEQNELRVWGATRNLPAHCLVLEVIAPGLLVAKHSRSTEESGKFINIAVIEGDQIKIIDQHAAHEPDCPAMLTSLLGLEAATTPANPLNQLAISMRGHGRGGSLLVVPDDSQDWRESILTPITYEVVPPFSALAELMTVGPNGRRRQWQEALRRTIDKVAGLTAVDGATIITNRHRVLAFGAKILRRRGSPQIDRVLATEPIRGTAPVTIEPSQLGGTRHLSAAQFVYDQRNAIALIASQDGRFTVFGWSPCEETVHAHRIETLLL